MELRDVHPAMHVVRPARRRELAQEVDAAIGEIGAVTLGHGQRHLVELRFIGDAHRGRRGPHPGQ